MDKIVKNKVGKERKDSEDGDETDNNKNNMAGVLGVSKAAKTLNKKIGKVPKSCRANTMDLSKAQAIMGFSSTRWLDKSAGFNPKDELDKAHFEKMMDIMKKKKNYVPPKSPQVSNRNGMRRKQLTPDDECRVLHEAYQFLFRKYNLGEELQVTNEAAFQNGEVPPSPGLISPFMKMELDTGADKKILSLEELEAQEKAENDRKEGIEDNREPDITAEEEAMMDEMKASAESAFNRLGADPWPSQQEEEDDDDTMARKVKSARSKKEKKPLKEPKSKKDRSKSMLPGAQQDSLSGGGLTAALAGKEERRSSATPGSQADFLQAIGPQGGKKTRSGSIKVPGGSLLERRGSSRGSTRRKKNKDQ